MKYGSGGIAVITVIWWNSLNNDLVFIVVVHLVSICVLFIAFRDQSHYSIVQFMRYVTRGGFTNFVTMPYLGEEGPKLRKIAFCINKCMTDPFWFGLEICAICSGIVFDGGCTIVHSEKYSSWPSVVTDWLKLSNQVNIHGDRHSTIYH